MGRLLSLICLGLMCLASAVTPLDPRGARPVEHGTRDEKCANQKEWPFCTSDEWGPKCPSGCRIQGLLDKYDHDLLRKIEKIRSLLEKNKSKFRATDLATKQTYDSLKDKLLVDSGNDNNYYDLAQNLRRRITDMKIKIDTQLRILGALRDRVKDQVLDMQRLEVDIDIKLRSCKGSCQGYAEYQVDHESYVALEKQINQLDTHGALKVEVGTLSVMKSKPLKDVIVDSRFKTGEQRQDAFEEVKTAQLILEEEGSSSSPATISKEPVCQRLIQDGRRPQSPGESFRKQRCRAKSDVGLCTDDDWVSKCPSGCRLQGLMSQMEMEVERKLRKVCKTAKTYEDAAEKSMKTMTQIYNYNRQAIVHRHTSELVFVERADGLTKNLTLLRNQSSKLSRQLEQLRLNVRKQVEDLYRTEVDIDMTLRTCRGSCRAALPLGVDHSGYETLRSAVEQMEKSFIQKPREAVPRIKLQPVDVSVTASAQYKTIPWVQSEPLTQFEDIGLNRMVLEEPADGNAADSSELE